jgi:hypothetical protein
MRGWGVTFCATAAACVWLPFYLALIFVVVVAVAALMSLASWWADRRVRAMVAAAKDTAEHQDWVAQMRALDDAYWEKVWDVMDGPTALVYPGELRSITRIPRQREAGSGS